MNLGDYEFKSSGVLIGASSVGPVELQGFSMEVFNLYDVKDDTPTRLRNEARAIEICEMLNKSAARERENIKYV